MDNEQEQMKLILKWVNDHLQEGNENVSETKSLTDFKDVKIIVRLIEIVTNKKFQSTIQSDKDSTAIQKDIESFFTEVGVGDHIKIEDLNAGNLKTIWTILWSILRYEEESQSNGSNSDLLSEKLTKFDTEITREILKETTPIKTSSESLTPPQMKKDEDKKDKKKKGMLGFIGTIRKKKAGELVTPGGTWSGPSSATTTTQTPGTPTQSTSVRRSRSKSQELIAGYVDTATARDMVALEIYTTEITYCEGLETIVKVYLPGLKEMCTPDEIKTVFSNVEVLWNFSTKLLAELETRIEKWSSNQLVADIFLKFYPFLRAYNQYCNNYDEALATYVQLNQRPEIASFLKQQVSYTEQGIGPDLQSLLITPVQRIPRYMLLLKELLSKTPADHPDKSNLENALEKIKSITDSVNNSIKQTDKRKVVQEIAETITGIANFIAPHRKYIMETSVNISGVPTKQGKVSGAYSLMLFTDMLFVVSNQQLERRLESNILLLHAWLHTVDANTFEILSPDIQLVVKFDKPEDKIKWTDGITEQIKICVRDHEKRRNPDSSIEVDKLDTRFFEYSYHSGNNYKGEWKDAKMHGEGTFTFVDGKYYIGSWKNGLMEGNGKMSYGRDTLYEGQFEAGAPNGAGVLTQQGIKYSGEWKNGQKHGKGTLSWPNGDIYEGEFKNDRFGGKGTLVCSNGDRYDGTWDNGMRHGRGVLTTTQYKFEGQWFHDLRHGEGIQVWHNGDIFKGLWNYNMKQGPGKFITANSIYVGDFLRDKREGKGKLIFSELPAEEKEGDPNPIMKYEGQWKGDKKNGFGTLTTKDTTYEGSWVDDQRHGQGTFTDPSGTFIGEWFFDKRNGNGVFIAHNKNTYQGKWVDDIRVQEGEITFENKQGKTSIEKISAGKFLNEPTGFNMLPPVLPAPKLILLQ